MHTISGNMYAIYIIVMYLHKKIYMHLLYTVLCQLTLFQYSTDCMDTLTVVALALAWVRATHLRNS